MSSIIFIEDLEKKREEKLIQVLELRNQVQELVSLWEEKVEEIKEIEIEITKAINDRSNKNN